jgi:glycosyltransferase involved in cell wall biosynthesis
LKVIIFTAYPWLNISTPLIETIHYFLRHGWDVVHFGIIHSGVDKHGHKNIEIENENYRFIPLGTIQKNISNIKKTISSFFFYFKYWKLSQNAKVMISFDPGSLFLGFAWLLLSKCKNKIYHSLEISNHTTRTFLLEKFVSSFTNILVTQDKTRGRILRVLLNYRKQIAAVPNSTSGNPLKTRLKFFHETLKIPQDKKILLMTGTIDKFTGSDSFLSLLPYLPNDWVLVIHGWVPSEKTKAKILSSRDQYSERLYISSALVENKDKFDIFLSIDACFVYFRPDDLNLKYALFSAGKLFDAARTGVPVLINQIPGAKSLIFNYPWAHLLKGPESISEVLRKISQESSQPNSFEFYQNNEFSMNYERFLNQYCDLNSK